MKFQFETRALVLWSTLGVACGGATNGDGSSGDGSSTETTSTGGSTESGSGTESTTDSTSTNDTTETGGTPECGNGVLEGDEECDDGENNGPEAACLEDCVLNVCGDGHLGPDEQCDDGNLVDDDGCSAACEEEPFNYVFVTSTTTAGNIGSLAIADTICNDRAEAANLPGTYVAWLSTDVQSAIERFDAPPTGPFRRVDLVVVADDFADLTDGTLDAPINLSEEGKPVAGYVWSDTDAMGMSQGDHDCSDWSTNSLISGGYRGNVDMTDLRWTSDQPNIGYTTCDNGYRLYCFEND